MRLVRFALVASLLLSSHAIALAQANLDTLFAKLRDPDVGSAVLSIEPQIWAGWMQAGSTAQNEALAKASASMNAGDGEGALRQLNTLVDKAPDFAEVWNKRATLYFLLGRFDESLADIVKTLDLEPRHFGALSGRGMIYQRLGRDAEALLAYKEALAIHPYLTGARRAVQQLEKSAPEL